MSKVYVVQSTLRMNPATRKLEAKFDVSAAEVFGELVYLLSAQAAPFSPDPVIAELRTKLAKYNPEHDYLLLIGNPCLIGWTVAVAAHVGAGRVNLLQWSGREGRYLPICARGLTTT